MNLPLIVTDRIHLNEDLIDLIVKGKAILKVEDAVALGNRADWWERYVYDVVRMHVANPETLLQELDDVGDLDLDHPPANEAEFRARTVAVTEELLHVLGSS